MMLKFLFAIFFLAAIVFAQAPVTAASANHNTVCTDTVYESYLNFRFGYVIAYPKNIFFPQPESDYADGRIFLNARQEEVLRVYGRYATPEDSPTITLAQQFNSDIANAAKQHKTITYKKLGKAFYVLSGYSGNTIFYQKTILVNGNFAFAIMQYPQNEKSQYDLLAARIFRSFK
jgi:hypothetical protein